MNKNNNNVSKLTKLTKAAINEYQCPGCIVGSNTECYEKSENLACGKHVAGTMGSGIGRFFLGMPTGFNRIGNVEGMKIHIFRRLNDGWGYDTFNVPVWKHLDKNNITIVRGICPRLNYPWIHIFLENCIDKINCIEITEKQINEMD